MTLLENDIEREARMRVESMRSTDIADDTVVAPTIRAAWPVRINRHSAYMEGQDIAAVGVAALMTLAPLAAYAIGLGA